MTTPDTVIAKGNEIDSATPTGMEMVKSESISSETMGTLLGGDAMIMPKLSKNGKVESYEVTRILPDGRESKFFLTATQGDKLIQARIAEMMRASLPDVDEEAMISLVPSYVAQKYRERLIALGTPEDKLPDSTFKMIEMAKAELIAYRGLGVEQIAAQVQEVVDEAIGIVLEVYKGNNYRYDGLPKDFKALVHDQLPIINALAIQHSGINEQTLEAQKLAFKITLLSKQETYQAFLSGVKDAVGTSADSIGIFFGNLIGGTGGAIKGSFERARDDAKARKPRGK